MLYLGIGLAIVGVVIGVMTVRAAAHGRFVKRTMAERAISRPGKRAVWVKISGMPAQMIGYASSHDEMDDMVQEHVAKHVFSTGQAAFAESWSETTAPN